MPRKTNCDWLKDRADYRGDDCLLWPFSRHSNGYGNFGRQGQQYYAHRFMCELVHGAPPTPKHHAAHSCGRGDQGCVHPRHVFWKTPGENQLDREDHGTKNTGPRGKITVEQKREIIALRGQLTQAEIAELYGITRSRVSVIHTDKPRREPRGWVKYGRRSYSARVIVKRRIYYLGTYETPEEAHAAYLAGDAKVRAGLEP